MDQLNVPKEIKGEFYCSFIGTAEYRFNYKKNYFISAKIDLAIKMKSEYNTGEKAMNNMDMNMASTNKYDIQFIGIEKEGGMF